MVTAAIGAEKYYTTENNAARTESLEQARDLDFKVQHTLTLSHLFSLVIFISLILLILSNEFKR
jgi:hypothetical protein